MKLILLIILLIIVIYLYNQTLVEPKKEYLDIKCDKNCGNFNIETTKTNIQGCLACNSCGVCTLNKKQICMNGNKTGAYFVDDCSGSNWKYDNTTTTTTTDPTTIPTSIYDYEYQLKMMGQTNNLPSQTKIVSYDIPITTQTNLRQSILEKDTANSLADLLNKINSSNQKNSINKDTVNKLQEILNKLTIPKT